MGGSSNRVEDFQSEDDLKYGKKREFEPEFRGPIKDRSCTDVLCFLLFVAFAAGWVAAAVYAFAHGNPERIIYPSNSKGEICGAPPHENKKYVHFFDVSKCARASTLWNGCPTPQVCVERCPTEYYYPYSETAFSAVIDKQHKKHMQPFCSSEMTDAMVEDESTTMKWLIENNICPPWLVTSAPFLKRCLPSIVSDPADDSNTDIKNDTVIVEADKNPNEDADITAGEMLKSMENVARFLNVRSLGEKVFADLASSWWLILIGLVVGTILSFVWIILMRFVAAVMIWSSLVLSIALGIIASTYCFMKFWTLKQVPEDDQVSFTEVGFTTNLSSYTQLWTTWLIFFILSAVFLLIILLILIFLRKRIRIAIELIEEGSIAVGSIMSTLFFPVVPFLLQLIWIGFFVLVALFLASSGEQKYVVENVSENSCVGLADANDATFCVGNGTALPDGFDDATCRCVFHSYGNYPEANWLQLYNLFALLWGLFFLSAFEEMVMAGAFASWYWAFDKKDVPAAPLTASVYRSLRYHLGTLAFGSLIIAILRFIRIMIEVIEERLKEYSQDNPIVKCFFCCCRCCFWCLEKFMRFLNRNAYIMTAVYGKNFCWSAKEAFFLLLRNAARVIVLDKVTDFLILLGKLVVVGVVGIGSFYVFSGRINVAYTDTSDLNYYFVPIIIVTLGTYFIADIFFDVYEMAVDTLFLCFLEDIERNDGTPEKPYYMSKDLKKILGYMENPSNRSTPRHRTPDKDD